MPTQSVCCAQTTVPPAFGEGCGGVHRKSFLERVTSDLGLAGSERLNAEGGVHFPKRKNLSSQEH